MTWEKLLAGLRSTDLERTKRSLALLPLAAFVMLYGVLAFLLDPSWRAAFVGLALCYFIAFLALGSDWFWARWYAVGLAWSGFLVGVYGMVSIGVVAPLVIYASLHGLVVLLLRGKKIAAIYEGQQDWRERYGLDEHGANRVGKAVTRTSGSLPTLVIWALAPKQPESLSIFGPSAALVGQMAVAAALTLAVLGLVSLIRNRTVGVFYLLAAAVSALLAFPLAGHATAMSNQLELQALLAASSVMALAALGAAFLPFVRPLAAYLRER